MDQFAARSLRCGRVLRSPEFVVSLAVLVVNDRWLKAAAPGLVTGKLSDVAGVLVAAVLLAVAVRVAGVGERRSLVAAVGVTAVLFTVMKTSEAGASAAEWSWSLLNGGRNQVIADRSDLWALCALLVVPQVWKRTRTQSSGRPRRSRVGAAGRAAATVGLLAAGLVATTATSCAESDVIDQVVVDGNRLVVLDPRGEVEAWSADGGSSWYSATHGFVGIRWPGAIGPQAGRLEQTDRAVRGCIGESCWEVVDGHVDVLRDGDRRRAIAPVPNYADRCSGGAGEARSVSVVQTDEGPLVVVAMGGQGIATSRGDGSWTRIAVGDTLLPSGFGRTWPPPFTWFIIGPAVPIAAAVLGVRQRWRDEASGRPRRRYSASLTVFAVVLAVIGTLMMRTFSGELWIFNMVTGGVGVAVVALSSLCAFMAGRRTLN